MPTELEGDGVAVRRIEPTGVLALAPGAAPTRGAADRARGVGGRKPTARPRPAATWGAGATNPLRLGWLLLRSKGRHEGRGAED